MIVVLCSAKGAPGVTTAGQALGMVWPGESLLVEADPSSHGDLAVRTRGQGAEFLETTPTIVSLALDARAGTHGGDLGAYTQLTTLGLRVVPGATQSRAWASMRDLWPQVTARIRAWPGTVIVDLGRLEATHPAMELVQAADVILMLAEVSVEGLGHVRERSEELSDALSSPPGPVGAGRGPRGERVGVVLRAGPQDRDSLKHLTRLGSIGSHVPFVGALAQDERGVRLLREGTDLPALGRTPLVRSAGALVASIQRIWPALACAPAAPGRGLRKRWVAR